MHESRWMDHTKGHKYGAIYIWEFDTIIFIQHQISDYSEINSQEYL